MARNGKIVFPFCQFQSERFLTRELSRVASLDVYEEPWFVFSIALCSPALESENVVPVVEKTALTQSWLLCCL